MLPTSAPRRPSRPGGPAEPVDAPDRPAPDQPARGRRARPTELAHLRVAAGWDLDVATGRLSWADPTFRLVGTTPGAVEPTTDLWWSLVHEHDRPRARAARTLALSSGIGYQERLRLVGLDGVEKVVHAWTEVATDADGSVARLFGACVDVTGLERLEHRDALTGLLGRAALEVRSATAVAAARPDRCAALLVVDVDRFGRVNDTRGRHAGDQALRVLAARLRAAAPAGSTVVRLGGDTFGVLATDLPTPGMARDVADDVAAAMALPLTAPVGAPAAGAPGGPDAGEAVRAPASLEGIAVSISVGVALCDGMVHAVDVEELVHRAELALRRAKAGGGGVLVFHPEIGEQARARTRTEAMLREALAAGRLQVLYQPVVDLATGDLRGVEALCRVVDPQLGPLSPALFMDIAEETGLVVDMDEQVLRHATAFAARWRPTVRASAEPAHGGAGRADGDAGSGHAAQGPTVAVNMSPRSLARPELASLVEQALRGAGAAGQRLLVEITEHSLLERGDGVRATLGALERLGVSVGVDDFGTGWSALSYLSGLDLGFLKVDRSFVARLGEDAAAEAVVRAIVDLAHAHHLVCIAEGVETQAQARALAAMGCDHGQGWWFGRPTAESALDATLAAWRERARATGFGSGVPAAPGAVLSLTERPSQAPPRRGRHLAEPR